MAHCPVPACWSSVGGCRGTNGQPAVNVRINTMKGFALDLAGPEIAAKGVSLIAAEGAAILVDSIASRLLQEESGYLSGLQPSGGLSLTMLSAIEAVRLAGLEAKMLRPGAFEVLPRPRTSTECSKNICGNSNPCNWLTMRTCCGSPRAIQNDPSALNDDVLIIVPEDLELTALERELLDSSQGANACSRHRPAAYGARWR